MGGGIAKNKVWQMSKINLKDLNLCENLSFKDDMYFCKNYASLYSEAFEFDYIQDNFIFKTIACKEKILDTGYYDLQSPYGYNGFYCNTNDEDFIKKALKALKEKALRENIIAFFVRFHPFDKNLNIYKKNIDFFQKNKNIIIVNTKNDIEQIRENYSPRIRAYAKKARSELDISFCKIDENKKFKELYEKTMKKVNAQEFYFFSDEYFNNLYNFKEYFVLKASFQNEILAFASFFLNKDFSYYHLSANTSKYNANLAVLDFFFEFANLKNSKFCILGGGVNDNDGLFKFKSKFSNLESEFYIGGLIFDKKNYNYFCKNYNNDKFLKYKIDF